jgi:hypothetical protein
MANSLANQAHETAPARDYRAWVFGLSLTAMAMLGVGMVLASAVDGVARPWAGVGFVLAMGLALVVGASKTSSA